MTMLGIDIVITVAVPTEGSSDYETIPTVASSGNGDTTNGGITW